MAITDSMGLLEVLQNSTDQGMNHGVEKSVLQLADESFKEVVAAVSKTGKTGKLTLTLSVQSDGEKAIAIIPDWKVTLPPAKKVPFVGFADKNGNVYAENPSQLKMPVREKMASLVND